MNNNIDHIARRIGVSRLANLTGLDRVGLNVVAAVRPLSRNISVSFGKGETLELAKLSAVMEAAELFYSEMPPHPPVLSRFDDLDADDALDPAALQTGVSTIDVRRVCMEWVHGYDIRTGAPVLVPWQTVSMDFTSKSRAQARHLQFGATGLAAGFDRKRAILHGLFEVVERDCHDSWNALGARAKMATLLDLDTVADKGLRNLLAKIAGASLSTMAWDMTGAHQIPCYLVEVMDFAPDATTAYVQGAAADINPVRALQKAITEALQVRLTYIAGSRDDLDWSDYGQRYENIVANRHSLQKEQAALRFDHESVSPCDDVASALAETCMKLGAGGAHRIIAVPLTRDDEPVAVVKIVVPSFKDVPDADEFDLARTSGALEFA